MKKKDGTPIIFNFSECQNSRQILDFLSNPDNKCNERRITLWCCFNHREVDVKTLKFFCVLKEMLEVQPQEIINSSEKVYISSSYCKFEFLQKI